MARYNVPIIGDGLTPETAFRPDLPEGLNWSADVESDSRGKPLRVASVCEVAEEVLADVVGGKPVFVIVDDADYLDTRVLPHNGKIVRAA